MKFHQELARMEIQARRVCSEMARLMSMMRTVRAVKTKPYRKPQDLLAMPMTTQCCGRITTHKELRKHRAHMEAKK